MTSDEYRALAGVNWSSLKHLHTSALLYRHRVDNPEPDKTAYLEGRVVDCATLEPHRVEQEFAVYDDRRAGKAWDAWQEDHPGVTTLKSHEMGPLIKAALAIRRHPVAARLLEGARIQAPVTWTDAATGVACKGRLDVLGRAVVDIKSTKDVPTARNVAAAASRYLYHGQLAFYHDGAIATQRLPPDAEPPWLISVQKAEPNDVACDQLNLQDLQAGRDLYRGLLRKLLACTEANYWPGVAPEARQLALPDWAPGIYVPPEEDL